MKFLARGLLMTGLTLGIIPLEAGVLVLETVDGKVMRVVEGDEKLMDRPVTPASTFKIILAWAALEEGLVEPGTKHLCKDRHVPDSPREITLKEAMFYSSNDYFIWLGEKLGKGKILNHVVRSGLVDEEGLKNDIGKTPVEWVRGGDLKVTARQEHEWILKVMRGDLASSPEVRKMLEDSMEWPSDAKGTRLFGKTGSWGDTVWFNGFGEVKEKKKTERKAVTVLVVEKGAKREMGIRRFYGRWGMERPAGL